MRVSTSVLAFDGTISEKVNKLLKSGVTYCHIDYSEEYQICELFDELIDTDVICDMHIVSPNALSVVKSIKNHKFYKEILFKFFQVELVSAKDIGTLIKTYNIAPAIHVDTDISKFHEEIRHSRSVLIMTTMPGVSGGKFNNSAFDHIEYIKSNLPKTKIYVDGGIDDKISLDLIKAGVHTSVIGSFIAKKKSPKKAFELLSSHIDDDTLVDCLSEPISAFPKVEMPTPKNIIYEMLKFRTNFCLIVSKDLNVLSVITDGDLKRGLVNNSFDINELIKIKSNFYHGFSGETISELFDRVPVRPELGCIPIMNKYSSQYTEVIDIKQIYGVLK